jgi:hypothetical protein
LRTSLYFAVVSLVGILVLTSMADEPKGELTKAKISPARLKGMQAAIADLEKGVIKQKEYPPLPYPPYYPAFIRLLKSECGVAWEVVSSRTQSKDLRERMGGYNDLMRAEIEHRFGRDIFKNLIDRAKAK